MCLQQVHSRSERTSYASAMSLNTLSASSTLSGFLSGCHLRAILRYLEREKGWNNHFKDKRETYVFIVHVYTHYLQQWNPYMDTQYIYYSGTLIWTPNISTTVEPLYGHPGMCPD